jgi:hypothetical protein
MSARAKYWRRVVAAWERSGLSQAEFCRRRNVNYAAFGYWRRRLQADGTGGQPAARRDAASERTPPRFIEVALPWGGVGAYELTLRCGRSVRVPAGFSADDLTRLITAVESC